MKQDAEIIAEFLELRPKLLAYILDTIVKALEIKPTIKLNDSPRMADFAVWGEAIARAMGYKDLQFLSVYYDNIGKQNVEAIDNSPLGQAIVKLINKEEGQCSWVGPLSKALEELNAIAVDNNLNTSKAWPKAPHSLSRRLKPLLSNLHEGPGIKITITRNTAGDRKVRGTFRIIISPVIQQTDLGANQGQGLGLDTNTDNLEVPKLPSLPSPASPDQIHEGNQDQKGEGISEGEVIYLHPNSIASPKYEENHVQNPKGVYMSKKSWEVKST